VAVDAVTCELFSGPKFPTNREFNGNILEFLRIRPRAIACKTRAVGGLGPDHAGEPRKLTGTLFRPSGRLNQAIRELIIAGRNYRPLAVCIDVSMPATAWSVGIDK
jgi:hypothetical protein